MSGMKSGRGQDVMLAAIESSSWTQNLTERTGLNMDSETFRNEAPEYIQWVLSHFEKEPESALETAYYRWLYPLGYQRTASFLLASQSVTTFCPNSPHTTYCSSNSSCPVPSCLCSSSSHLIINVKFQRCLVHPVFLFCVEVSTCGYERK